MFTTQGPTRTVHESASIEGGERESVKKKDRPWIVVHGGGFGPEHIRRLWYMGCEVVYGGLGTKCFNRC